MEASRTSVQARLLLTFEELRRQRRREQAERSGWPLAPDLVAHLLLLELGLLPPR